MNTLISMEISSTTTRDDTKDSRNSKSSKNSLPVDVVMDIISRLPVKSVFQSQCISKDFSSITSNPYFIDAHLQQSARLCPSIVVNKWDCAALIQCSSAPDSEIIAQDVIYHPDFDLLDPYGEMTGIVGSCNGLLLVVNDQDFEKCYLWNPSTHKCDTRIPALGKVPYSKFIDPSWAFGYCSETREYKIVRVASYDHSSQIKYVVEVLSYGKDIAWRRLHNFSKFNARYVHNNGLAINGVVYWVVKYDESWLLAFDLAKEVFRRSCFPVPTDTIRRIMEFKGLPTVCHKYEINEEAFGFDLWVLKDESSWEKIYTFEYVSNLEPVQCLNDRYLILLNLFNYPDEALDHSGSDWPCCLYDMEHHELKEIPGAPIFAYDWFIFHKFVESIVALHGAENVSEHNSDGDGKDLE